MVTIKEVAKEAGVGLGTASRALSGSGSISLKSKEKVLAAAKKLGFSLNQSARNLRKQTTDIVALIIPTIDHIFFSRFALHCEEALYRHGYHMMVVNSQDDKNKEMAMLEMIRHRKVDGIIFSTHYEHSGIDASLPIVTIDGHLGNDFPCVTSDNYKASFNTVKWLFEHGARKIGCVSGVTEAISETSYRYQAYSDCIKQLGLEERLLKSRFKHGEETEVVDKFLETFPDVDAVFATSDMLALAAYNQLTKKGKKVPEDIQIIGFDGIINASYSDTEFTVVRQDIKNMAEIAVENVINRINGVQAPERVEVPTQFVLGGTTKNN